MCADAWYNFMSLKKIYRKLKAYICEEFLKMHVWDQKVLRAGLRSGSDRQQRCRRRGSLLILWIWTTVSAPGVGGTEVRTHGALVRECWVFRKDSEPVSTFAAMHPSLFTERASSGVQDLRSQNLKPAFLNLLQFYSPTSTFLWLLTHNDVLLACKCAY